MYLVLFPIFIILLVIKHLVSWKTLDAMRSIVLLKNDKIVKDELYELATMSTPQILEKRKYLVEIHKVTTEDGYILEIHRIPGGKNRKGPTKPPVLFIHGLQGDSASFVLQEDRLAYQLADLGYDVWLGNVRGTTYGKSHRYLNFSSSAFWNFSAHELGIYDNPAMIDHILTKTSHTSLYYIGSSQGTLLSYVMLSKKPEYNKKIRLNISFTPALCLKNTKSFKLLGYPITQIFLQAVSYIFGEMGLLTNSSPKRQTIIAYELWRSNSKQILSFFDWLVGKINVSNMDLSLFPVILSHFPSGASYKQLRHFGQIIRTGVFGEYLNSKDYWSGKFRPYEVKNITAPVALFYAEKDNLIVVEDVENIAAILPNVVFKKFVPGANHFDHLFAKDANETHYKHVINLCNKY